MSWRKSLSYLEDSDLQISTKDGEKQKTVGPPKIRGKHFTNMDYLANAELIWLTSNLYPSRLYDSDRDDSYFEQCFRPCEKLGEGSFGSVIKVKLLDDDKMYAMKVSKEPFRNESDRKLKVREVEHHQVLSHHQNIVTLHNAWEEDRFIFMQLELCKPSMEAGKPLSEQSCWNVLVDILQALDCIHESERGHFDIKVENILLGQDDLFKLSDFGLMLMLGKDKEIRKEGDAKYVAPELIVGGIEDFTPKADIFSLGISVLEMAGNLELPSHGEVWNALRKGIFPLEQTKHLSDDLFELLMQMMASDPAKRPSAKEILALPKMKALIEERRLMKLKSFLIQFGDPPMKNITVFFLSFAWSISVAMLYILAKLMTETPTVKEPMNCDPTPEKLTQARGECVSLGIKPIASTSGTKNYLGPSTSRIDSSTESASSGDSEWSVSSVSDDSGAFGIEESVAAYGELPIHGGPFFSSTPMCMPEVEYDTNENVVKSVKRQRRERSESLNSDGMEDSGPSSVMSLPPPSPPRQNILYCDWLGINSPDRAVKEESANRTRLHCPAESLLQYGISPLRLSKECKRDYREKKRLRIMTPRNLAESFDEDNEEESS